MSGEPALHRRGLVRDVVVQHNVARPCRPLLVDKVTAAKLLGVSPGTVFNMSAPRGPLPCVRFQQGGHAIVRYAVKDLETFIETMTTRGANPVSP